MAKGAVHAVSYVGSAIKDTAFPPPKDAVPKQKKMKLVLDETKPLNFYNIKSNDVLVLRKKFHACPLQLKFTFDAPLQESKVY
jgi:hypothetical protein